MKNFLYLLGGASAILAVLILKQREGAAARLSAPVDELAHRLQDAWADHHTVV